MIRFTKGGYDFIDYSQTGSDWIRYIPLTSAKKSSARGVKILSLAEVRTYGRYNIVMSSGFAKKNNDGQQQEALGVPGSSGVIYIGKDYSYIVYDSGLLAAMDVAASGYAGFCLIVDDALSGTKPDYGNNYGPWNIMPTESLSDGMARLSGIKPSAVVPLSGTATISTYSVSEDCDPVTGAKVLAYKDGSLVCAFKPTTIRNYAMPINGISTYDEQGLIELGKELAADLDISELSREFKDSEGFVDLTHSVGNDIYEAARGRKSIAGDVAAVYNTPEVSSAYTFDANIMAVADGHTLVDTNKCAVRSYIYDETSFVTNLKVFSYDNLMSLCSTPTAPLVDLANGFAEALTYWVNMRGIFLTSVLLTSLSGFQRLADATYDELKSSIATRLCAKVNELYAEKITALYDQYVGVSGISLDDVYKKVWLGISSDRFNIIKPSWMQITFSGMDTAESTVLQEAFNKGAYFVTSDSNALNSISDMSYDCIFNKAHPIGVTMRSRTVDTSCVAVYSKTGVMLNLVKDPKGSITGASYTDSYIDLTDITLGDTSISPTKEYGVKIHLDTDITKITVTQVGHSSKGDALETNVSLLYASDYKTLDDNSRVLELVDAIVKEEAAPFGDSLTKMADSSLADHLSSRFSFVNDEVSGFMGFGSIDAFRGCSTNKVSLLNIQMVPNATADACCLRYTFKMHIYDEQRNKWGTARDGMKKISDCFADYVHNDLGRSGPVSICTSISALSDCSQTALMIAGAISGLAAAALATIAVVGCAAPVGTVLAAVAAGVCAVIGIVCAIVGRYKFSPGPGDVIITFDDMSSGSYIKTTLIPPKPESASVMSSAQQVAYLQRVKSQADIMAMVYIQPILDSMSECAATMYSLCRFDNGGVVNASTAAQVGNIDTTLVTTLQNAMSTSLATADIAVQQRFQNFVVGLQQMIDAQNTITKLTYYTEEALGGCTCTIDKAGADLAVYFGLRV